MMDQATRRELEQRLERGSWDERLDAARAIGLAGIDGAGVRAALRILARRFGEDVGLCVQDGLIEGAPSTIDPLIEVFRDASDAELSDFAGGVLGELAYRQGTAIDPRIVAAAIEQLRWSLATNLARGEEAIALLRECVWSNRVPDALALVEPWLERVASMRDHDPSYAFRAMEFIFAHRDSAFLDAMREKREALAADDPFRQTIEEYLEMKAKGEAID